NSYKIGGGLNIIPYKKGGGRRALYDFELLKIARLLKIPHFIGVFTRDKLPVRPRRFESGIVNLDTVNGTGTHWVAYKKIEKKNIFKDAILITIITQSRDLIHQTLVLVYTIFIMYTITLNGNSGESSFDIFPPIEVENTAQICLLSLLTNNSIPNIEPGYNSICFRHMFGINDNITIHTARDGLAHREIGKFPDNIIRFIGFSYSPDSRILIAVRLCAPHRHRIPSTSLFTHNRSVSVPYPYCPFGFSTLDLHNTVPCPIRIRCPCPFSAVRTYLLTNARFTYRVSLLLWVLEKKISMTGSAESLEDLAVLALLLDEEEKKNNKQKRIWVHDLWKKRKIE
ncbi:protein ALP1-like, partial [Aphis craccivora]